MSHGAIFDLPGQRLRRAQVLTALADQTMRHFDDNGTWSAIEDWPGLLESWPPGPSQRERLWFAAAYLCGNNEEAAQLANRIIVGTTYRFCHFSPMTTLQILTTSDSKLDETSRAVLIDYLDEELDKFAGPELDFVGVNDNFPCMSTYIVLMGGTLLGRQKAVDVGVRRLSQLKALLTRRGVASEYCSPTYTAVQIHALAHIANSVEDDSLRKLALQCEERIWADLLGHYHPETSQLAGPYSRAYTADSTGHTNQAQVVLYYVLGDQLTIHPMNTLFASKDTWERPAIIHQNLTFAQVSAAWLATTDLHAPETLVHSLARKTYPFTFEATTEYGPSTDDAVGEQSPEAEEYPAGNGIISTYMTADYAIGVATNGYHNGNQSDAFHLLYRRKDPVRRQPDVNTVYARYIANRRAPGQFNKYPSMSADTGPHLLWDEGRKLAFRHERTAMVLYRPKRFTRIAAHSLALSLLLPSHYGPPEEIWLGDRKLTKPDGHCQEPCPVFIKDGLVYMAFHPLLLTNHGRDVAVQLESINGYTTVSFTNYRGAARDFAPDEIALTGNGFVVEISSVDEQEDFAAFRNEIATAHICDELFTCDHYRRATLRRTSYERGGVTLECEYSPTTEGVKSLAVNGRTPRIQSLEVTGLKMDALPFIQTQVP